MIVYNGKEDFYFDTWVCLHPVTPQASSCQYETKHLDPSYQSLILSHATKALSVSVLVIYDFSWDKRLFYMQYNVQEHVRFVRL